MSKAEELKQRLLKLVFYREPEDDDIIYLRLSRLCTVVEQYADKVSRDKYERFILFLKTNRYEIKQANPNHVPGEGYSPAPYYGDVNLSSVVLEFESKQEQQKIKS